jgi:hypothetical protein
MAAFGAAAEVCHSRIAVVLRFRLLLGIPSTRDRTRKLVRGNAAARMGEEQTISPYTILSHWTVSLELVPRQPPVPGLRKEEWLLKKGGAIF